MNAGLTLKPPHFDDALHCRAAGLWLEVHPENYMVDGGPRLAWLHAIRERHALSLHGVALSLAADCAPDAAHLERLAVLVDRLQPVRVSEHLAWSQWQGAYHPDLLPVPRTRAVLQRVVDNIDRVQQRLRCAIALENPSHYLHFDEHAYCEAEFLAEIARRAGCALLVDVNNAHVSAHNLGTDAAAFIDALPGALIAEVHLAGHHADTASAGALLIDSHDAPVAEPVWALYERLIGRVGPKATLIERDDALPSFANLLAERERAQRVLQPALAEAA